MTAKRKEICLDEEISEKVREISISQLLNNEFGLSLMELYDKVAKTLFQQVDGYDLTVAHFILSIFQTTRENIMVPYEPFTVSCAGGQALVHHKRNKKEIDRVVEKIYKSSNLAA